MFASLCSLTLIAGYCTIQRLLPQTRKLHLHFTPPFRNISHGSQALTELHTLPLDFPDSAGHPPEPPTSSLDQHKGKQSRALHQNHGDTWTQSDHRFLQPREQPNLQHGPPPHQCHQDSHYRCISSAQTTKTKMVYAMLPIFHCM